MMQLINNAFDIMALVLVTSLVVRLWWPSGDNAGMGFKPGATLRLGGKKYVITEVQAYHNTFTFTCEDQKQYEERRKNV